MIFRFMVRKFRFTRHKQDIGLTLIFFFVSFLYLLCFASASSPLSTFSGSDYGIFRTFGYYLINGDGVIYKDLFDNKGPYLFLIQALGVTISHGKWGIFILETFNLTICLWLYYKIGLSLSRKKWITWISILIILGFHIITIERGNSVEEWSLLFVLLPLYTSLKIILTNTNPQPIRYGFYYGICFGVIAFIRINNAAINVGIIIGLTILYAYRRQYADIMKNAAAFLGGVAVASLPPIIYFACHGALYDMIYATFIYNIYYKATWHFYGTYSIIYNLKTMSPLVVFCVVSLLYDRKNGTMSGIITIPSTIVCLLTFYHGCTYMHYFAVTLPIFFIGFVSALTLRSVWGYLAIIYPFFAWGINYYAQQQFKSQFGLTKSQRHFNSIDVVSNFRAISPQHLDSVYILRPYDLDWDFLYDFHKHPVGKYFTQQDKVSKVDEYVREDILRSFEKSNPRWIISTVHMEDSPLYKFTDRYELSDSTEIQGFRYYLLRRIKIHPR